MKLNNKINQDKSFMNKRLHILPYDYSSIPMNTRHNRRMYRLNAKSRGERVIRVAITLLITIVLSVLFMYSLVHAIDTHIDNQDRMLCNSAKVSGNEEYLNKCECFYSGQDISCIQKGGE